MLRRRRWDVASKTFSQTDPRKSEADDLPEEEAEEEEEEEEELRRNEALHSTAQGVQRKKEEEEFRQCSARVFDSPVE